ncbi:MAG TPA: hemolysin III family protein [Candidatus Onthousia faecavium]|nr:hemolysin III family protein [Candidatus Onthousia faecavium]
MRKITIPKYSLGEEIINAISHGLGVLLGITALILTIIFAAKNNNTIGIVSACIYGSTMIIMYLMSCLYHSLSPRLKAKKVFRVIDHCDIYIFIAGCYTPYCLSLIKGTEGIIIFIIIWLSAIIGVLLNAINLEKFQIPSTAMYLIMGWLIIFSYNDIKSLLPSTGLNLLIGGGVIYTIGAILYGIGSKRKYFHSVFHFFVLAGSVFHFFSILLYVM